MIVVAKALSFLCKSRNRKTSVYFRSKCSFDVIGIHKKNSSSDGESLKLVDDHLIG